MEGNDDLYVCQFCETTTGTHDEVWNCYCEGATRERILVADEQAADWSLKKTRGE